MALVQTDAVDVLQGGRVIATLDAGIGADNKAAMQQVADAWRGGVISRAERGDAKLSREDVLGIPQWRQELSFRQRFMDGANVVHKYTSNADRLAKSFGDRAYRATQGCIAAHVEQHKAEHAELLRKNAAKYEEALAQIEREETSADRLRDKIRGIKDPERRAQLKAQYPELFERF